MVGLHFTLTHVNFLHFAIAGELRKLGRGRICSTLKRHCLNSKSSVATISMTFLINCSLLPERDIIGVTRELRSLQFTYCLMMLSVLTCLQQQLLIECLQTAFILQHIMLLAIWEKNLELSQQLMAFSASHHPTSNGLTKWAVQIVKSGLRK